MIPPGDSGNASRETSQIPNHFRLTGNRISSTPDTKECSMIRERPKDARRVSNRAPSWLQCHGKCCSVYAMSRRNHETVAAKVRGLAAERRMPQQSLADLLGLSRMGIYRRLNGETPFTLVEVITLTDHFGVSAALLFGENDAPALAGVPLESASSR